MDKAVETMQELPGEWWFPEPSTRPLQCYHGPMEWITCSAIEKQRMVRHHVFVLGVRAGVCARNTWRSWSAACENIEMPDSEGLRSLGAGWVVNPTGFGALWFRDLEMHWLWAQSTNQQEARELVVQIARRYLP